MDPLSAAAGPAVARADPREAEAAAAARDPGVVEKTTASRSVHFVDWGQETGVVGRMARLDSGASSVDAFSLGGSGSFDDVGFDASSEEADAVDMADSDCSLGGLGRVHGLVASSALRARRCSGTSLTSSSTSTTTSSCEGDDSIQLEPAGFSVHAGWRRPSQCNAAPPGFAVPGLGPGRRLSDALASMAGLTSRKASVVNLVELGGRATRRRASSTLHDVREFAAAAVAMSRKASAHVIEALELQELPGLRRLQHQGLHAGVPFQRLSFTRRL